MSGTRAVSSLSRRMFSVRLAPYGRALMAGRVWRFGQGCQRDGGRGSAPGVSRG